MTGNNLLRRKLLLCLYCDLHRVHYFNLMIVELNLLLVIVCIINIVTDVTDRIIINTLLLNSLILYLFLLYVTLQVTKHLLLIIFVIIKLIKFLQISLILILQWLEHRRNSVQYHISWSFYIVNVMNLCLIIEVNWLLLLK